MEKLHHTFLMNFTHEDKGVTKDLMGYMLSDEKDISPSVLNEATRILRVVAGLNIHGGVTSNAVVKVNSMIYLGQHVREENFFTLSVEDGKILAFCGDMMYEYTIDMHA